MPQDDAARLLGVSGVKSIVGSGLALAQRLKLVARLWFRRREKWRPCFASDASACSAQAAASCDTIRQASTTR